VILFGYFSRTKRLSADRSLGSFVIIKVFVHKLICIVFAGLSTITYAIEPSQKDVQRALIYAAPHLLVSHLESYLDIGAPDLSGDGPADLNWSVSRVLENMTYEFVQLDFSETPEVIVTLFEMGTCGSGGCSAHVLKIDGSRPRYLGEVWDSGELIQPSITGIRKPDSGFHEFAFRGTGGFDVYYYDRGTKEYRLKQ